MRIRTLRGFRIYDKREEVQFSARRKAKAVRAGLRGPHAPSGLVPSRRKEQSLRSSGQGGREDEAQIFRDIKSAHWAEAVRRRRRGTFEDKLRPLSVWEGLRRARVLDLATGLFVCVCVCECNGAGHFVMTADVLCLVPSFRARGPGISLARKNLQRLPAGLAR